MILNGIKMGSRNFITLIFCEEPEYALVGFILSKILRVPFIYDSHGNKYLQCIRLRNPLYYRLYITFLDIFLAKKCSVLLVVSEFDRRCYINQGVPPGKIYVIPSFIDLEKVKRAIMNPSTNIPIPKGKKTLLFFGNYNYEPNVEALRFINNELAPAIDNIENVEIYICGRSPVPIEQLVGPLHRKVKYLGFVPDIYEVLNTVDAFICPIWTGVGIIVKVLDAMAVGKPIVGTKFLREGIPELNENNALLARNKQEFIYLVRHLLEHYDEYKHMGQVLQNIIATRYSRDVIEKKLYFIILHVIRDRLLKTKKFRKL